MDLNQNISARSYIKNHTQLLHEAAEKSFEPIFNAQSKLAYAEQLSHYANFYIALENLIFEYKSTVPDFDLSPLRRADLIRHDTRVLEARCTEKILSSHELPKIQSKAQVLGALYVIEGSKLGGQIITKSLSETLGVSETDGCSFFYAHGPNTGFMWKSFLTMLEKELNSQQMIEEAAAAASDTFQKITNWMNQKAN